MGPKPPKPNSSRSNKNSFLVNYLKSYSSVSPKNENEEESSRRPLAHENIDENENINDPGCSFEIPKKTLMKPSRTPPAIVDSSEEEGKHQNRKKLKTLSKSIEANKFLEINPGTSDLDSQSKKEKARRAQNQKKAPTKSNPRSKDSAKTCQDRTFSIEIPGENNMKSLPEEISENLRTSGEKSQKSKLNSTFSSSCENEIMNSESIAKKNRIELVSNKIAEKLTEKSAVRNEINLPTKRKRTKQELENSIGAHSKAKKVGKKEEKRDPDDIRALSNQETTRKQKKKLEENQYASGPKGRENVGDVKGDNQTLNEVFMREKLSELMETVKHFSKILRFASSPQVTSWDEIDVRNAFKWGAQVQQGVISLPKEVFDEQKSKVNYDAWAKSCEKLLGCILNNRWADSMLICHSFNVLKSQSFIDIHPDRVKFLIHGKIHKLYQLTFIYETEKVLRSSFGKIAYPWIGSMNHFPTAIPPNMSGESIIHAHFVGLLLSAKVKAEGIEIDEVLKNIRKQANYPIILTYALIELHKYYMKECVVGCSGNSSEASPNVFPSESSRSKYIFGFIEKLTDYLVSIESSALSTIWLHCREKELLKLCSLNFTLYQLCLTYLMGGLASHLHGSQFYDAHNHDSLDFYMNRLRSFAREKGRVGLMTRVVLEEVKGVTRSILNLSV